MLNLVIFIPLITSAVVRTFGWMILLSNNGALNASLKAIGIIDGPLALLYTELGIVIALAEVLLPFMVLALDAALLNIDVHLYDAARSLGASRLRMLVQVTIPLAAPGIVSESILVFMMSVSAYVTPALVGGPQVPVMSTMIGQGSALVGQPVFAGSAVVRGGRAEFALEVDGRLLADTAVAPTRVVPTLDPGEDRHAALGEGLPTAPVDEFAFQAGEKALGHRVVVGIETKHGPERPVFA
jgi:hypothetical protein